MKLIPRKVSYFVVREYYDPDNPSSYYFGPYRKESEAKKELEKRRDTIYTWNIFKKEVPIIPVIIKARDYCKFTFKAKYEVISTTGSSDLCKSLGQAIGVWIWLTFPKLYFAWNRLKMKVRNKSTE